MSFPKGPGWPDARGFVALGFFGLEFYMLWLIKEDGTLLANAAFMQVMTALTTGGVLLIATNLFGGTKSGAETSAKLADAYTSSNPPPPAVDLPAPAPAKK